MGDYTDSDYLLNAEAIHDLSDLVNAMSAQTEPWSTTAVGERQPDGSIEMPYTVESLVVQQSREFLYNYDLIVAFDWSSWDEGKTFFKDATEHKFEILSKELVLKLLTAVVRNDRFSEGAWAGLFESGDAQKLFSRLLDIATAS